MEGMKALLKGVEVKVLDASKGWIKIEEADGAVRSVRRAELDFIQEPGDEASAAAAEPATDPVTDEVATTEEGNTMETNVVTMKDAKKAKVAKPPKATKKAAKPAAKKAAAKKNGASSGRTLQANGTVSIRNVDGKEYTYERAGKTPGGSLAYDNGDEAALKLRGKTLDEVYTIVAKAMLKKGGLKGDFAKCESAEQVERKLKASLKDANAGRQRMTLGNRLRGALRTPA